MSVYGDVSAPAKAAVYCAAGLLSCEGRTEGEGARETERERWQLLFERPPHSHSQRLTVTSGNEAL